MINNITKATATELAAIISSEIREIAPVITIVTKKMVITQRIVLLRSRLELAGSDLGTMFIPFVFNEMMTAADRINLTA